MNTVVEWRNTNLMINWLILSQQMNVFIFGVPCLIRILWGHQIMDSSYVEVSSPNQCVSNNVYMADMYTQNLLNNCYLVPLNPAVWLCSQWLRNS